MRLDDFVKTDVYENANCIEYIGIDGMELPYDQDDLMEYDVVAYHIGNGGYLEIQLNTL